MNISIAECVQHRDEANDVHIRSGADPDNGNTFKVHLALALPLQNAYNTVKGAMTCVSAPALRGNDFGFTIREPLTTISWGAPRGVEPAKKVAVVAALNADAGKVPVALDPYFFGKQARARARRNRICVVPSHL